MFSLKFLNAWLICSTFDSGKLPFSGVAATLRSFLIAYIMNSALVIMRFVPSGISNLTSLERFISAFAAWSLDFVSRNS